MTSDLLDADATELARRVREGEVRALELVEASIAAIEAWNPALNAVVHRMYDRARSQAASPGAGRFAGVPFVFKDLDGTLAGEPLHLGSRFMVGYVAAADTEMVRRIKSTGVIPVAKTATPELGIMGTTEPELGGPTRNPWNLDHSPGGSSGGTAALVASRAVPMGHGGDGGGSIRIPASACGLVGLKTTRARNPLGPDLFEGWGGFVQSGVLTRTVRDTAAMLDATSGPELGAPYVAPPPKRPYTDEVGADPGRLRIAFTREALYGTDTHPDCVAAVDSAVSLLSDLGHTVVEARPAFDRHALVMAYLTQVAVCVAATLEDCARITSRPLSASGFEAPTWLLAQIGWRLGGLDLHRSREAAMAAGRSVATFFQDHDLFLTATTAFPAVRIGELALKAHERLGLAFLRKVPVKLVLDRILPVLAEESLSRTPNTQLFNQTGNPAVSLPLHWNQAGLPIGVQLAAPFGDEAVLLRIAAQLEVARPWIGRRPPAFSSTPSDR